jgi:trehalose 6-phosphate phosphatase
VPATDDTHPLERFAAVLFDMDGVLTATASLHEAAWKEMFDSYLRRVATERGTSFAPFEPADYKQYVDGKLRYDGVAAFLQSRDIELPWGDPADDPSVETVCGLGNRKNAVIQELLRTRGVDVFTSSIELVTRLRADGVKTAVVSASKNCVAILAAAGISELFDARVDGNVAAELGLAGKPAPDTFLEASRRLGVPARQAVVVEDAISGVQAGRAGEFGLVVGVDRTGDPDALKANGADLVVADLGELLD